MGNTSQGLQGAAGGAMAGSAFGPLGTLGGGLIGGALGYFGGDGPKRSDYLLPGYDSRQQGLNSEIGAAGQVGAPQYGGTQIGQFQNAGMGGEFRAGQGQLIGQLQQQASGQGPSLATGQFNQALGQGVAAQQAQANTGTGNQALAGRMAAQNIGGMTQNLAGQAAQARIQEQMNARQQLAGVLGQARGQEMQGGQFNAGQQNQRTMGQAGFDQQTGLANQNATLRNRAQQNQYGLGLRELEFRNARGQQEGLMGYGGTQQNQVGTQMLSGGGMSLANRFGQGSGQGDGYGTDGLAGYWDAGANLGWTPGGPMDSDSTQFGSGYGYQGGLGGPTGQADFGGATDPISGAPMTGAQTGYTLPRL